MSKSKPVLTLFFLCFSFLALAQSAADPDINSKIRKEEMDHSQIMHTMHFLADVYGPRLTGSPNHKAAANWVIQQMQSWGLENAHLEPWDFGHPGWSNEQSSGYIVSPIKGQLDFRGLAWTPSTKGTVKAQVFQLILPEKPTKEQLTAYLDSVKDKVNKRIVLAGKSEPVPVAFDLPPRRIDDKAIAERYDPKNPNAGAVGNRPQQANADQPSQGLTGQQINEQVDQFLVANHALIRINDAHR